MPDFLSDLYANVREIVAATWPETKANGIWEVEHIRQVPWAELVPPYAVIAVDALPAAEWGAVEDVYAPSVQIYYVAELVGPVSPIRASLMALRKAFNDADQAKVQVIAVKSLTWSDSLLPNQFFLNAKNDGFRAGQIIVEVLVGEEMNP